MFFYKIKIKSLPQIAFACSTTTDNYKNMFDHRENLVELSTVDGVEMMNIEGKTITFPKRAFTVAMPDLQCTTYAKGRVTIDSVAMNMDGLDFERVSYDDIKSMDTFKEDSIYLPLYLDIDENYVFYSGLIKTFISYYLKNDAISKMKCLSIWFDLLSNISNEFIRNIKAEYFGKAYSPTEYYVRKTKNYIEKNDCKKLKISDIASELGISANYLSGIFKQNTGKTILEYINLIKVEKARKMICQNQLSLQTAAEQVGFSDVRYLRTLFKKYYGVTIHDCKMIDHEISLYHQKPWDVPQLNHDLLKGGFIKSESKIED